MLRKENERLRQENEELRRMVYGTQSQRTVSLTESFKARAQEGFSTIDNFLHYLGNIDGYQAGLPLAYKIGTDEGDTIYLMRREDQKGNNDGLMVQINDDLVRVASSVDVHIRDKFIEARIELDKGKSYLIITINYDQEVYIEGKVKKKEIEGEVTSIERVNRVIKARYDDEPGFRKCFGITDDSDWIYTLNEGDQVIQLEQHPKRWKQVEGEMA